MNLPWIQNLPFWALTGFFLAPLLLSSTSANAISSPTPPLSCQDLFTPTLLWQKTPGVTHVQQNEDTLIQLFSFMTNHRSPSSRSLHIIISDSLKATQLITANLKDKSIRSTQVYSMNLLNPHSFRKSFPHFDELDLHVRMPTQESQRQDVVLIGSPQEFISILSFIVTDLGFESNKNPHRSALKELLSLAHSYSFLGYRPTNVRVGKEVRSMLYQHTVESQGKAFFFDANSWDENPLSPQISIQVPPQSTSPLPQETETILLPPAKNISKQPVGKLPSWTLELQEWIQSLEIQKSTSSASPTTSSAVQVFENELWTFDHRKNPFLLKDLFTDEQLERIVKANPAMFLQKLLPQLEKSEQQEKIRNLPQTLLQKDIPNLVAFWQDPYGRSTLPLNYERLNLESAKTKYLSLLELIRKDQDGLTINDLLTAQQKEIFLKYARLIHDLLLKGQSKNTPNFEILNDVEEFVLDMERSQALSDEKLKSNHFLTNFHRLRLKQGLKYSHQDMFSPAQLERLKKASPIQYGRLILN